MSETNPSQEEMLKEIIGAQVKGGFDGFKEVGEKLEKQDSITEPYFWAKLDGFMPAAFHPLDILLDPSGLRAAYGDKAVCEGCLNRVAAKCHCELEFGGAPDVVELHLIVAHEILDAWLSKPEGNAEQAIKTAYDLLPSPNGTL